MQEYVIEFRETVERATPLLLSLTDDESAESREPDSWSPRQIIGHLIDSAANNHSRFVLGQFQDNLIFPGYAQEDWVRVQKYDSAPWAELVYDNYNALAIGFGQTERVSDVIFSIAVYPRWVGLFLCLCWATSAAPPSHALSSRLRRPMRGKSVTCRKVGPNGLKSL
jgi:hypothetical protein